MRSPLGAFLLTFLAGSLGVLGGTPSSAEPESADPARDLKSKNVERRLAAVETLRANGGDKAAGLLEDALGDDDWEVAERAAEALGERGRPESVKPLGNAAVGGRVWRVRRAAARSLARVDPEAAAKDLTKDLRTELGARAAEAIAIVAQGAGDRSGEVLRKGLERSVKAKDGPLRAAAAAGLVGFAAEERPQVFERLLDDEEIVVAAAALDEASRAPDPRYFSAVLARLESPALDDVLERRAAAAIRAVLAGIADESVRAPRVSELAAALARAKDPLVAARLARLVGTLAAAPPPASEPPPSEARKDGPAPAPVPPAPPVVSADVALRALEPALAHKGEAARASAVAALGRIRTPEALDRAFPLAAGDPHARVRLQALRALAAGRGISEPGTLALALERLAKDPAPAVREQAAVLLGASGPDGAAFDGPVAGLAAALADAEWTVAAVAAVSLGKTQSAAAVEPLQRTTGKPTKDWRRRGAAVVGLGHLRRREAVPPLIAALEDKDGAVRRTAYEYLRRLTPSSMGPNVDSWRPWWARVGATFEFVDRQREAREAKKGGYAPTPIEVYERLGTARLDIVVLQSRGDHIEKMLTELKIEHRITRAAAVAQADLHPFCIFVSNCTGEIQAPDVDRLQWFVRVGGYLFCSCWALHHTVELVYPGLVQKLPTRGEVLDNVAAQPCPAESVFLEGVFPDFTRPVYVLYGSHLIQVLQPERVEVLIDSPEAAQRWGGGNLACWFPAGHGLILDSANHFDLQGLQRVTGLKTGADRMAYAMDRMGVDYPEARRLADEQVWEKQAEALERVRDLSAFRFITNFVREKRKVGL